MTDSFDIDFKDLPGEIPVFPLPRVILLPRVQLPLNIFEPRYLAMTAAALAGGRLIGMIQPRPDAADGALFATGCAGRIVSFAETEGGRCHITLKGVCRFDVTEELPPDGKGFRKVRPDWTPYAGDTAEAPESADICREAMMQTLRGYFDKMQLFCDKWEEMQHISCEKLVSTLSVVCPLDVAEKQALLEAQTLADRANLLQAVLQNATRDAAARARCH